jgi:hypothetical protein
MIHVHPEAGVGHVSHNPEQRSSHSLGSAHGRACSLHHSRRLCAATSNGLSQGLEAQTAKAHLLSCTRTCAHLSTGGAGAPRIRVIHGASCSVA